jgi:tetratricopeptide (TPR) repeat protein
MNPANPFERHLMAAEGFIELGMPLDAAAELEEIDPELRTAPEVLALRIRIYSTLKTYAPMQAIAKALAQRFPDDPQWTVFWAFATRRADCVDAARLILVNAVERLPEVAIFHYNLACYDCQLGALAEAKTRLQRAFALDPRFRLKALKDADLEPLWDSW